MIARRMKWFVGLLAVAGIVSVNTNAALLDVNPNPGSVWYDSLIGAWSPDTPANETLETAALNVLLGMDPWSGSGDYPKLEPPAGDGVNTFAYYSQIDYPVLGLGQTLGNKVEPVENLTISAGYTGYVVGKYDQANAGAMVFFVNGTGFTLPEFWTDVFPDGSGKDQYRISHYSTVVPEPATYVAGALLLLPFGVSALRVLRKKENRSS